MTTAFVLSGGGSLGAIQVGMLQALHERGVHADLLVGTSAGALNAVHLGRHGQMTSALDSLATRWSSLRRGTVFRFSARRTALALGGARPSLFAADGLRSIVSAELDDFDLADSDPPVRVVTTDLLTGRARVLSSGDAVAAALASAAIPGILPPVVVDGVALIDGGLADHGALLDRLGAEVDDLYVLPTGSACDLRGAPASAYGIATHALTLLIQQGLASAIERYSAPATLHVLPPLCPLGVSPADFSHGADLVVRARDVTARWLDGPPDTGSASPAANLSLHSHHARPGIRRAG